MSEPTVTMAKAHMLYREDPQLRIAQADNGVFLAREWPQGLEILARIVASPEPNQDE